MTGDASTGSLRCTGEFQRKEEVDHVCAFHLDVNECAIDEDVCGGGICFDLPFGLYYYCFCDYGYKMTGDPSTMSRTCKGKNSVKYRGEWKYSQLLC